MAFRNTSTSDNLSLASAFDYNGDWTIMWWHYVESFTEQNQALVVVDDGTGDNQDRFGVSSNGQTVRLTVTAGAANTHTTGSSVDSATWNHFTMRRESTTLLRVLKNGGSVVTNTRDVTSRSASNRVRLLLGGSVWRIAGFKAWNAELTDAEIAQEMQTLRPVRTANLWAWLPLHALDVAGGAVDFSGNGRTFTVNGAPDLVAGPPLSWGAAPLVASTAASGPATVTGAATLTGTGSLSASGLLTIPASATLSGSGDLTASATVTGTGVTGQATLSGTGILSASGLVTVLASAALSGAGSLSASATTTSIEPKSETFTDTFDDLADWTDQDLGSVTSVASGGQLVQALVSSSGFHYGDVQRPLGDLTDSFVLVQVVEAVANDPSTEMGLSVGPTLNTDDAGFRLRGGTLSWRTHVSSSETVTTLATFDPDVHRWWRVSESGGTLTWSTSPNGVTWTVQHTAEHGFDLGSVTVSLWAGTFASVASPGQARWDNLNLPRSVVPTSTLARSGSGSATLARAGTGSATIGRAGSGSASLSRE